jgi:hypothetical protein
MIRENGGRGEIGVIVYRDERREGFHGGGPGIGVPDLWLVNAHRSCPSIFLL